MRREAPAATASTTRAAAEASAYGPGGYEEEERRRWTVRDEFAEEAYDRLIRGRPAADAE